ncbi:MAG: WXG100 family type VII secretion target [Schaalia hyovaginalis]|uniref:WXG100 family type VII secretion target n=1 Tax=Schaalia hyovaginalis TaxID=29316 RepID=UPI0026EA9D14|nr:WXG100 family type VII secretion target [Schaalia hyovaginalis]MCI7512243.1 WXG100 family type VII secretion target [Schaalia hyovaginalis]MDY6214360.1 WXG100 family type VII secretion target [Schaalia hyovaginalis]
MTKIVVDPSSLSGAATDLGRTATAIDAALEHFDADTSSLRNEWEGDAAEAAFSARKQWRELMMTEAGALRAIAAILDQTGDVYAELDRKCGAALGGQ